MMTPRTRFRYDWTVFVIAVLLAALMAAGCGGQVQPGATEGAATTSAPGRGSREVPTMPPLRMAQPTTMINPTRVAELRATPSPEQAIDVEFGGQVYARLCAECHGAAGEGVADKGEAVAGMEMDEAALTSLLRTGGEYGREHIFGLDKVSPEGVTALHAWMQALPAAE